MSVAVIEPIKTIDGLLTYAIAAESQLLYSLQRQDLVFTAIFDSDLVPSTQLRCLFDGDISSQFAIGQLCYVESTEGNLDYRFRLPIVNVVYVAPNTNVYFDFPYTNPPSDGGLLNNIPSRPNYRILVVPKSADGSDFYPGNPIDLRYVPNQEGRVSIDLGDIVSVFMKQQPFTKTYFLRITEEWTASTNNPIPDTTTLQAVLASKQLLDVGGANMWENLLRPAVTDVAITGWIQSDVGSIWLIPDLTTPQSVRVDLPGTALVSQVIWSQFTENFYKAGTTYNWSMIQGAAVTPATQALQLNIMGFFQGSGLWETIVTDQKFPDPSGINSQVSFSINFTPAKDYQYIGLRVSTPDPLITLAQYRIWSLVISPQQTVGEILTRFENPVCRLGWNRTGVFLIDQLLLARTGVDSFTWNIDFTDINKDVIDFLPQAANFDYTPRTFITNILALQSIIPANAHYVRFFARHGTENITWSNTLFYRILPDCDGIGIDWINQLGGVDQWVFTNFSVHRIESDAGIVSETPIISDIENIVRTKRRFAKSFRERVTMRETSLTLDQLLSLQEIKQTESLRVYLSKDGVNYIDAIVVTDFSSEYDSNATNHKFTLVIEFPDDFIFQRAKLY